MVTLFEPALGSVVKVAPGSVFRFRACCTNGVVPQVWTNAATSDQSWSAISLEPIGHNLWEASVKIPASGQFRFTYRLLSPANGGLRWLGKANNDGQLVVASGVDPQDDVSLKLKGSKTESRTGTNDVVTQLVSVPVSTGRTSVPIPQAISFEQALVLERPKPTWYEPKWINSITDLSTTNDVQFIVFHRPQSSNGVSILYPISTSQVVSTVRGNSKKGYSLCTQTDEVADRTKSTAYMAVATGPGYAIADAIDSAVSVAKSLCQNPQLPQLSFQSAFQSLRFCTWNSLGPDFTVSKTLDALASFKKAGFLDAIDTVLLDDGWQDLAPRPVGGLGLQSFGAKAGWMDLPRKPVYQDEGKERKRQDSGYASAPLSPKADAPPQDKSVRDLKQAVEELKAYEGGKIRRVGVWLTLAGYWGAIDPNSPLAQKYDVRQWSIRDAFDQSSSPRRSDIWYLPSLALVDTFWDDYFGTLKAAGVDYVKVDNQASTDYIFRCESHPNESAGSMRAALHRGMHKAANNHFGAGPSDDVGVINCMSHSPRTWGGAVDLAPDSQLRASDDFFPDEVESHSWHLLVNSLNALFIRSLSLQPDFDMMMTKHKFASYHAAFRTFSPSPIYVTDTPGEHDPHTVDILVAPLKQGGSAVVKTTNEIGAVLAGRMFDLSQARYQGMWGLLKVGLALKTPRSGVLGVWNVQQNQQASSDVITLRDIVDTFRVAKATDEFEKPTSFVVSFMKSGRAVVVDHVDWAAEATKSNTSSATLLSLQLDAGEWDIGSICPLYDIPGPHPLRVACVGLVDKACGLAGITSIGLVDSEGAQHESFHGWSSASSAPSTPRRFSIESITSTITTALNQRTPDAYQTVSGHGRIRHLLSYVSGNRDHRAESSFALRSLRQDLLRHPVKTLLAEAQAMMKVLLALAFLAASSVWSRVMRTAVIQAARSRSRSSSHGGSLSEKTPLLNPHQARARPSCQGMNEKLGVVEPNDAATTSPPLERVFLRVETPFVGRLGFIATTPGLERHRLEVRIDGKILEPDSIECSTSQAGYTKVIVDVRCSSTATEPATVGSEGSASTSVIEIGHRVS